MASLTHNSLTQGYSRPRHPRQDARGAGQGNGASSAVRGSKGLVSTDYIEVAGARIAYRIDGDPAGVPVLFSNSLASDLSMWDEQVAALSDRYRVIRYDTRGHGASSTPAGDYSIEQLAGDVIALLDHLRIDAVHFVGLSLGGMVGQWLGARQAARIRSLTLCDTACEMASEVWSERIQSVRDQGLAGLLETTLSRWFTPAFAHEQPEKLARVRRMIERTRANGYVGCAAAIRDMALVPLLGSIRPPTLVVVGAEDPSTPVADAKHLHEAIAGSSLIVIPDAAHLANLEQPEAFNRALLSFLDHTEAVLVEG